MTSKQTNEMGVKAKLRAVYSNITVEPVIILFLLPSILLTLAVANLNLEKACRVKLQLNETVCHGLSIRNTSMYTAEEENLVQKQVASMNAWKTVIQSVIPACLLLSFGAWSDKRQRRKPFMALPIIGEIITVTGFILCTYFFYEFSMEATGLIETLPTALTGGWFTMFMAVFSYVADTSTTESRTVRIGAVNICNTGSVMVGIGLSGILYYAIGLYPIFSIALVMYISALLYTIFLIKEKGKTTINNKSKCSFFTDFFIIEHIKSTFQVAFRPRKKNFRKRIWVTLLLLIFIFGPMYGEINVVYLFARKRFQWSEVEFSIFYSINVVLHLIGIFVEMLSGTTFIAIRSTATKLVEPDELGKLSALTGMCEALMPVAYGSIYNLIYKSTIDTLPGTFYLVGSVLSVPTIALFCWLYIQHRDDLERIKRDRKRRKIIRRKRSLNKDLNLAGN